MLVFEFKAYGKAAQFQAIDEAIRTTQFIRNKAIRLWTVWRNLGLNSNDTVDPKLTNNVRIQTLVYSVVREQFGLSSNLAIRAINRVAGNRKTAKKDNKPVLNFKPKSADYDARIFSFREKDWTVSLTLNGGRERTI